MQRREDDPRQETLWTLHVEEASSQGDPSVWHLFLSGFLRRGAGSRRELALSQRDLPRRAGRASWSPGGSGSLQIAPWSLHVTSPRGHRLV
jgi:hypothetical protein